MRYMPAKAPPLPHDLQRHLAHAGERLRLARLRRGKTAEAVAADAGLTRVTLARLEAGDGAATLATLLKVMAALGLQADFDLLAEDHEKAEATRQVRLPARRLPTRIRVDNYPQLRSIAWHLQGRDVEITPEQALELYERNWRHIDTDHVLPRERDLIDRLRQTVGHGVILV